MLNVTTNCSFLWEHVESQYRGTSLAPISRFRQQEKTANSDVLFIYTDLSLISSEQLVLGTQSMFVLSNSILVLPSPSCLSSSLCFVVYFFLRIVKYRRLYWLDVRMLDISNMYKILVKKSLGKSDRWKIQLRWTLRRSAVVSLCVPVRILSVRCKHHAGKT
jgi:hypothetical protein